MRIFNTLLILLTAATTNAQATWELMEPAPAAGRFWAAATGNSTHGYAGGGRLQFSGLNNQVADMYEYEVASGQWTQIQDYPGGVREGMDAFTIGERIFFCFGSPFIQFTRNLFEYVPATSSWVEHDMVPGIGFAFSHGFVIDDTYYIGPENGTNLVYAFNGTTNTWSEVAPFPGNDRRAQCAFSANGKGYLGMGAGVFSGVYGDWWEYDPIADSWTEIADVFPNADQASATAIGNVGYLYNTGGGTSGGQQLYTYDANANLWNEDAHLPGDRISNASMFNSGEHGYLVFGESSGSGGNTRSNALWRITPNTSAVQEFADPFGIRLYARNSGRIWIRTTEPLKQAGQVELFDACGMLVASKKLPSGSAVDVELGNALADGVYLMRLRAGDEVGSQRVVVVR